MSLVWSKYCIPPVKNGILDPNYLECCSARFEFNITSQVTAGPRGTYYPNKCTAFPTTLPLIIGPMVIDTEIVSAEITVDDEFLINGAVFEPGQHLTNLSDGIKFDGTSFPGGLSQCNGQYVIATGTFLVTVPRGESVAFSAGDNHGISLFMRGAVIVKPVTAP